MKTTPIDLKSRQKSSFPYPVDAFAMIASSLGKTPAQSAILRRVQVVADDALPFSDPFGTDYNDEVKFLVNTIERWGKAEWSRIPVEQSEEMADRLTAVEYPELAELFRQHGLKSVADNVVKLKPKVT